MNKEDTVHSEILDSPKRIFQDHQKLRDAIWKVYSDDLIAAQEQEIILPTAHSRRPGSHSSRITKEADNTIQVPSSNWQNRKLVPATGTNLTKKMEKNTNRKSISPQLEELLDYVLDLEDKKIQDETEISSLPADIGTAKSNKKHDTHKSLFNIEKILKPPNQEKVVDTHNRRDVNHVSNNQNYTNMHTSLQSDEEEENARRYSKRVRLPGIEQVINKTSFASQRSDYYNEFIATSFRNEAHGNEIIQENFSNQLLTKPKIAPYHKPSRGRPPHSRKTSVPETFNPFNERMAEVHRSSPLSNPLVSKSDLLSFPNVTQVTTSSVTLSSVQFQSNVSPQSKYSGILELGIPQAGQTSPSVNYKQTNLNNNEYQKYKTYSSGGCCLPDAGGSPSLQIENVFPPNAMNTHSNSSVPYQFGNRPNLVKDVDYQRNLHHNLYSSMISSSVASSTQNQTSIHLANSNVQKPRPGPVAQSPTFSANQAPSYYNNINSQGANIPPTTPSNLVGTANALPGQFSRQKTNYVGQHNIHYTSGGPSTPVRHELIQRSAGQTITKPTGGNLQFPKFGSKNPELVIQPEFPIQNKSQWSGPYGDASAQYKTLHGLPAPISSTRVQEFSSQRTQELLSLRSQDSPSVHNLQITSPSAQQYPSCATEFPYTNNEQLRPKELSLKSTQEFPSTHVQFVSTRPDLHALQLPQSTTAPTSSTSALDLQMMNLMGVNQFGLQNEAIAKDYSQTTVTRTPRKRRATKGISVAQTKRLQKKRKQVEERLCMFLNSEIYDDKTSLIISKHLYHTQTCTNWLVGEDCSPCNQICEMVMHSTECQVSDIWSLS
ncbi:uncharacterized protein [Halyomorpha halys]|uniref:uncharacterized protein n=1 Tax=Halyomorpha halys TaxID=286706 RepID=UPI0006D4D602